MVKPYLHYQISVPKVFTIIFILSFFYLTESQFYRLVDTTDKYRVTKVEYVVNPVMIRRFQRARQKLKEVRGEKMSYPVLAFHGTKETNIHSICDTGFKVPGEANFEHATDIGNNCKLQI